MLSNYLLMAMLATSISALPLNINLGAYSPALVVGDGEISFGGKADVSNLMSALEGAAVSGAATNGATTAANTQAQAAPAPAAAAPATAAVQEAATESKTEAQVTALQGMGKEIAPRIVKLERSDIEKAAKRDIQTLNAALSYAAGAIKTSPEVQLGTEESGIGILVKAGSTANAAAGTAAKVAMGKRENGVADSKLKTTVTTMFIRGGPAVEQTSSISTARNVEDSNHSAVSKREPSQAIDGVNLNMVEGQVAELTFVETRSADDEE
ncbi:hypothetical protein SBOR_3572 [Sclerotinia borealis F-4128]|uniref:CSEP0039 effector protein n=1 Tax=Sclerotinia borealis (strain F-4128) TaxID=1432307 RepID=W9CNK8_SCLBF|nr:hypothetical protein SBOR_3572 [Sclerotinia borealis F-4128]